MTLKQIRKDHRVDDVIVDSHYEWKYTIYLDSKYLAGDDTSTIVAQTIKDASAELADVKLASDEQTAWHS